MNAELVQELLLGTDAYSVFYFLLRGASLKWKCATCLCRRAELIAIGRWRDGGSNSGDAGQATWPTGCFSNVAGQRRDHDSYGAGM
jgi:hypothetical protein